MSYNDPYARQRPDQQPYDPYYTAADQHVNYNNSYPPSNNTNNNSNPTWNEVSGPSNNQYDSSYAPERLSSMGVNEPPPKCAHLCCAELLRLTAKRVGIRANSDCGDTQSMDTSGQKYVDDPGFKALTLRADC